MNYKTIISYVFIGVAITALIGGFLLGLFKNNEEVSNDLNDQEVIDYTEKATYEHEGNEENEKIIDENSINDNGINEDNPHGEDYGDLGEISPQEVDKSKLSLSYEELLGKETTQKTKEIAQNFIEIFYNLDGDYPKRYIEKSKEYMTDKLYEEIIEEPELPTHYVFNRKYISSEISESKNLTEKEAKKQIPYIITVKGETTDIEGKNKQEVTDVYTILLIKDKDQYKVNKIYKNIYFQ